ncbi:MAG: aminotransferase class III-fold pyridoxal phosphate-dependent enzyme [Chlamydiia bacterium]|nr:aminotransferase class III-fold pyridoxal phosphate-dependent enzyme [Chlamydiia bacterium]
MLKSDAFFKDPDILKAQELIQAALHRHQKAFKGPKPADEALKVPYEKLLDEFKSLRGGALWYPYLGSGFGKGALVELLDGSVKYDFIGGIGVHYFGHSNPHVIDHTVLGALSDTVMEGHLQQNKDAFELSKLLTTVSGFDHSFLSSSGAMANENALKIAFQSRAPKKRVFAFEKAFSGRTLALAQITDKPAYRVGLPETLLVDHLPFFDPSDPDGSTQKTLNRIEALLKRHPNDYAVAMIELIQGEGGFRVAEKAFWHRVIDLMRAHDIAIFIDEVQSFGRTPKLFAFQHFGLEGKVDIVSIGKLTQICATLFTKEIAPKPGLLSQTFTASVTAIRAATWVIKELTEKGFYGDTGRIQAIHNRFKSHFERLQKNHPDKISGPWGIGVMVAFTYKSGDAAETTAFARKLFDHGLITFINGSDPTRIRMLPPALVVSDQDIDHAMEIIATCM